MTARRSTLRTFARAPTAGRQTISDESAPAGHGHVRHSADVTSLLDLQRAIGNRAVQRMLEGDGEVPVALQDGVTSLGTGDDRSRARSRVTHRHTLSAVIRRAGPAGQGSERVPALDLGAPAPLGAPGTSTTEPKEAEAVRFAALPGIDVPAQADTIGTTLTYDPSITPIRPPAAPTKFGQTDTRIEVNKSSGAPATGSFLVELVVENVITFWVAGGTRKNVASDADPNITQTNYPTVVSDLTPSPTAIRTRDLDLLKNQPPRKQFWAEDLTVIHEGFHADENEKFGREGAIAARDWLNGQTAQNLDQVEALVGRAARLVAQHITAAMAPPAVEQRAYDDGAAAYTARAQAIKIKGDAKGYAPSPSPAGRGPQ